MDSNALKTSLWQRIIIIVVALLLLGSTALTYMFIVLNGSGSSQTSSNDELINQLSEQYDAKNKEIEEAAKPLSEKYLKTFESYKAQVKAYNATTANNSILDIKDLKEGTGRALQEGDYDYDAYYIGWCADGSVFQSSFDDYDNPTALLAPISVSENMIEGWNQGVVGMKLGGVRLLTISGSLAYGDTMEMCGGYNTPLKFIVLAIERDETIAKLNAELDEISMQLYMAMYGIQY